MQYNFNANSVDVSEKFLKLSDGWHPVMIDRAEIKPNKNGTGMNLVLLFSVIGNGKTAGMKVPQWLCIEHTNADCQRIAAINLALICKAIGIESFNDSDQLEQKMLDIEVKAPKEDDGFYEVKNYRIRQRGEAFNSNQVNNVHDFPNDDLPPLSGNSSNEAPPPWAE